MKQQFQIQSGWELFRVELLEMRALLAGFTSLTSKGTLIVSGTSGDDRIEVSINGTSVDAVLNGNPESHDLSSVRRVRVEGLDGNDSIMVVGALRSTLLGGDGNDSLIGGAGDDTLAGGDGNNLYDYSGRTSAFEFVFGSATGIGEGDQQLTAIDGSETDLIVPTNGTANDTLAGTNFADNFVQFGMTGIEFLNLEGRGGNDSFNLNISGPDFVANGGGGSDRFFLGEDVTADILGGAGNDQVLYQGAIHADGGAGEDSISFSPVIPDLPKTIDFSQFTGFETDEVILNSATGSMQKIIGTPGPDRIDVIGDQTTGVPNSIPVSVYGGDGNDTILGGGGADVLFGGNGDDVLSGGTGDDTLRGEAGDDLIDGGPGKDHLFGHDGNDQLFANDGQVDTLDGGNGTDSATADKGPIIFDILTGIESS
ncbi:MAG TPA: calcium-binding protein [Tepidisphaeraceae bacterium]|nr:calcium-binding protein [Tepidisphaeraceae bacterium]